MSTLSTSEPVQNIPGYVSHGVWFDVQSEGPPLRITAILAACGDLYGGSGAVVLYGSEEGSGVGKERERGAWGQLAAGTLRRYQRGATRLVLSSPVSVRAGARVGLYLHCTDGDYVCLIPGKQGDVDARTGRWPCGTVGAPLQSPSASSMPSADLVAATVFQPAGAIEYELAIAEADRPRPRPRCPSAHACGGRRRRRAAAGAGRDELDASDAVQRRLLRRAERKLQVCKIILVGDGRVGRPAWWTHSAASPSAPARSRPRGWRRAGSRSGPSAGTRTPSRASSRSRWRRKSCPPAPKRKAEAPGADGRDAQPDGGHGAGEISAPAESAAQPEPDGEARGHLKKLSRSRNRNPKLMTIPRG